MRTTHTKQGGMYLIKATLENGTIVERHFPEAAVQGIMKTKGLTEKGAVEYLAVHTWVGQDSIPPPPKAPQVPPKAPVKPPMVPPPPPPPAPPASVAAPKTPPTVPSPPKAKDATVDDLLEELEDHDEEEEEEEGEEDEEDESEEEDEEEDPESPEVTLKDLEGMTYNEKIKLATDMHYFDKKNRSRTDLAVTTWLRLELKK